MCETLAISQSMVRVSRRTYNNRLEDDDMILKLVAEFVSEGEKKLLEDWNIQET